jgi:hypothetical protein
MKSVYIAGPYSGKCLADENYNISQAAGVASEYIMKGWAVFCPHTMTAWIDRYHNNGDIKYDNWLTMDIYWLSKCDAIHLLPGWRDSRGASVEYLVALGLGLEILGEV